MVNQKIGRTAAHTAMHHGHSTPIRYTDWKISHATKARPASVPRLKVSRTQRGSSTRARSSTPVKTTSGNAMSPTTGFGKPNTDAWSVDMTVPHDRTGLKSHEMTWPGSISEAMRS